MKHILFLLSILLGQPLFCQAQRLGDFLTNMVAQLDKTEITSNFLWDKGLNGLAEPAIFDGIIRDSFCIQPTAFGFLYAQARNAFVGTGMNPLPHPDVYMDLINRYTSTDTIPLAALVLRYHRIHKNAVDSNLLSLQNEQLFDVPGRTQSPYLQDTLFAFLPLKTEAWHTTVHFTLPNELIWQNMGWANPLLQANFDDGQGWQTLTAGQTYTIEYDSGGVKAIQTRIQQGSTILEAQSIIIVAEQPVQERGGGPSYPLSPEDSISINGGGGDLRIFYGSPCNKLLKPFIIVEGFELVNNPPQFQKRLENLMGKPDVITGSSQPLGEWLYSQGYDIVWVNLFDIQDHIQDNAAVVKAAVQKINEIKAANGSSELNMIMGVSAGGIITKYMLAKTNSVPFDHQCEKFFTYDVPLRGANIPLAVQCLLHHVNYIASENDVDLLGSNPAAATAFNGLSSPFARQTLLYRFTYDGGNEVLTSQEHEDFMAELDALGGIPIRHIALANGSVDNATRANISEGSQLFNVNTLGTLLTIGWLPLPSLYYIQVELHADGYALSNNPSSLVYDGNFSVIVNGVKLKEYALYVENERDKAYDTAPGGSSTLALSALGALDGMIVSDIGIPWLPVVDRWVTMSNLSVTTFATHYCFIPTRSAISAGEGISLNGPFSCGQGSSSRCTMSTEDTPLPDEYGVSTLEKNQDHVFLDARIGDVLVEELDAANLSPGGQLPSNLATYYNAGLPVQSGIPTVTISTGSGQLSINNTGRVGYSNGNEPLSPANLFNAYTKCDAVITVENSAKLVVGADGGAKHGILRVSEGSSVHIKSGGFLYVTSEQSKLLIKKGSTLILDAGAIVDLESYGSEIRIEGTLEINGDIIFRGYGYFHFSNGGTLKFGPGVNNFKLTGRGFGHRFMRLSSSLGIEPNHGIIWKQGKVEADPGGLFIKAGGSCRMDYVDLVGPGIGPNINYTGISADGATSLDFRHCEFKNISTPVYSTQSNTHFFWICNFNNIETGIVADGGGGGFSIKGCTFEEYTWTGATISNRPTLAVESSTWESETDSHAGLELHTVGQAVVKSSNFNGNDFTGPFTPNPGSVLATQCGAFLDNVPYFIMRNSGMTRNTIGIIAGNLFDGPSNVFLLNGSFIQRSRVGVYMDGTAAEGLVLMDCAALLHNDFGVFGTDVTLMIDAINAQQHPLDGGEPNTFLRDCTGGCDDLYFSLCYISKSPAQPIPMRENWWCVSDINTPQPLPQSFMSIFDVSCTTPVTVNTFPPAARPPYACLEEEFTSSNDFIGKGPEAECNVAISDGSANSLSEVWHAAYQQLRLEDFDAAEVGFQVIADLWQPDLSSYPPNCQLYIQVAKAIVDGAGGGNDLRPGGDRNTDLGKIVYANPNPTTGQISVAFPDGICKIRVFDTFGRLIHQTQVSGGTARLNADAWPVGIYTIEIIGVDFREQVNVAVQR